MSSPNSASTQSVQLRRPIRTRSALRRPPTSAPARRCGMALPRQGRGAGRAPRAAHAGVDALAFRVRRPQHLRVLTSRCHQVYPKHPFYMLSAEACLHCRLHCCLRSRC